VLLLDNKTSYSFKIDLLQKIANSLTNKDIELILVDDLEIKKINKKYRNIDKPTDVLSFPFKDTPGAILGIIVISLDQALMGAKRFGHSIDDEIALLFIHGILHLLGYDHEIDDGQMRKKEEEIIKKFNLPKSLIVRT